MLTYRYFLCTRISLETKGGCQRLGKVRATLGNPPKSSENSVRTTAFQQSSWNLKVRNNGTQDMYWVVHAPKNQSLRLNTVLLDLCFVEETLAASCRVGLPEQFHWQTKSSSSIASDCSTWHDGGGASSAFECWTLELTILAGLHQQLTDDCHSHSLFPRFKGIGLPGWQE